VRLFAPSEQTACPRNPRSGDMIHCFLAAAAVVLVTTHTQRPGLLLPGAWYGASRQGEADVNLVFHLAAQAETS